ncbi:MAG TPA: hypothetical protein VM238_13175 [Phycisphaerae bacterium]|nr:hypothetical protein [Phycisphaerae bacterium]
MPVTVPSDAPTWFIVLEYLKVLLTPTLLLLVFAVFMAILVISMRKARGMRCSAEYSALIGKTSAFADEVARRASNGELPADAMVKHLEGNAKLLAQIKHAKDIGSTNPMKEAFLHLLGQMAKEKSPTG